jgi:hypothetical protein
MLMVQVLLRHDLVTTLATAQLGEIGLGGVAGLLFALGDGVGDEHRIAVLEALEGGKGAAVLGVLAHVAELDVELE